MKFRDKTIKSKSASFLMISIFLIAGYASIGQQHVGNIITNFQLTSNFVSNIQNKSIPSIYIGDNI